MTCCHKCARSIPKLSQIYPPSIPELSPKLSQGYPKCTEVNRVSPEYPQNIPDKGTSTSHFYEI